MTFWDKIKGCFGDGGAVQVRDFFELRIEDVFQIPGRGNADRGVVVTGKVAVGVVRVEDPAVVRSANGSEKPCRVAGLEMAAKNRDSASAGDNVGVLLIGVRREDIQTGDSLRSAAI